VVIFSQVTEKPVLDTGTLHLTAKTGIVLDCMAVSAVDEFLFYCFVFQVIMNGLTRIVMSLVKT